MHRVQCWYIRQCRLGRHGLHALPCKHLQQRHWCSLCCHVPRVRSRLLHYYKRQQRELAVPPHPLQLSHAVLHTHALAHTQQLPLLCEIKWHVRPIFRRWRHGVLVGNNYLHLLLLSLPLRGRYLLQHAHHKLHRWQRAHRKRYLNFLWPFSVTLLVHVRLRRSSAARYMPSLLFFYPCPPLLIPP